MSPAKPRSHDEGLSVRDQIERYRTAFIAVVVMFVIAVGVAGYVLSHENFKLPSWVPVLGHEYFKLKADFQTAQAVTPGQGQAVTIAGAKVGEIASVELHNGVALVTMNISEKYARFYHDATLLLRPKTQLQDMTVEVSPGSPSSGRLHSGEVLPLAQTSPNVNFDEFLAGLDAETRGYLQELLAGAGEGLNHNGKALAAALKRFDPLARYGQEIQRQLAKRNESIASSIHNFREIVEALGTKDSQIAQLVDSSNAVFKTFAEEDQSVRQTLALLPGALQKTSKGLGKIATATSVLGPALHKLRPFASSLAPAQKATRQLANATTPVIKNEIRPFAREILPVVQELGPATKPLGEAFPKLAGSFSVVNEFFNELAYNPGAKQAGFIFFLDWANHDLNSVVSSADAHGVLGRSLVYFNCEILGILNGAAEVNQSVNVLVSLLRPPTKAECQADKLGGKETGAPAALRGSQSKESLSGILSSLSQRSPVSSAKGPKAHTAAAGGRG